VKPAAHLAQAGSEGTLFICDEPTTGLHFDDIDKLLAAFERLIDNEVIRAADWIIDMGPQGGDAGGRMVAQGTPEAIAGIGDSHTGRFLRGALQSAAAGRYRIRLRRAAGG
jgi:excinuclease ABC subunit A